MKKLFPFILLLLLSSCANEKRQEKVIQSQFAKSLKQAAMNYTVSFNESDLTYLSGRTYYEYLNLQSIRDSFTVTDSIKVENFWLLFFKYSINGHDYYNTDWFINIKGNYFISGEYISKYNVEDVFEKENFDLVNALVKKAETWESKSEKHWWKYIE